MSTQQKKTSISKSSGEGFSFAKYIPEKFQTPALLLLLLLLILIFFSPVTFGNKTTNSGDLIQVKSLRTFATEDQQGLSLWNPYIFCGMPAVATSMPLRWFDLTSLLYSIVTKTYSAFFQDYNAIYTFSFILMALAAFFFMRNFGASRGVSFLVAAATIFSTGIVLLFYIGHITKLMSLAIFPFILMMLFKFQKKITWLDVLLFLVGMHLLVLSAHVQIVFYFFLVTAIYFIYFIIRSFIVKDTFLQKQLFKSLGIVIGVGAVALLMSFDTYAQLFEYRPYSQRGTKSAIEKQGSNKTAQTDSYEYNTNWSFSPGEVLTFIIPSYYGFGTSTYNGPLTQNQDYEVHTYFGQMMSVDVAMYMGIVIFVLGIFTLIVLRRNPIVQFFGIVIVLFILLSFGKTFPIVFNLFYNYFPAFNNFRSPSMILHVVQLIFPILAGMGIMEIFAMKERNDLKLEKILKYVSLAFVGIFVIALILSGSIGDWFTGRINDYIATLGNSQEAQQQAQTFKALSDYITGMFTNDMLIGFGLLALTFGLIYGYIKSKLSKDIFVTGIVILVLIDLFRISSRGSSYIEAAQINNVFQEPNYISVIKKQNDNSPHRLLNLKQDGSLGSLSQDGNFNVYFLEEDFFGYSSVKPRNFQDIIENVGPVNPTLWRMLDVKYVITSRPYSPDGFTNLYSGKNEFVYRNDKALPRIYFVDSVAQKSGLDILNEIKNESFDPKKLGFVQNLDFKFDKCDSTSTSQITEYKNNSITAEVDAKGNNFLFYGTTYLPGWKAYIDGNPVKVYETNYNFQGIVVPKGKHKVEFIYQPKGFETGKYLSLLLNIFMFGGLGYVLYKTKKKVTTEKQ